MAREPCGLPGSTTLTQIIPEFQHLEVGDSVRLHPKSGYPYVVTAIEVGRALVFQIRVNTGTGKTFGRTDVMPEKYLNQSWVFFLDELNEGTTRLISRSRNDWSRSLGNALVFGIVAPDQFGDGSEDAAGHQAACRGWSRAVSLTAFGQLVWRRSASM